MNGEKDFYDSFGDNCGKSDSSRERRPWAPTKFRTLYLIEIVQVILTVLIALSGLVGKVVFLFIMPYFWASLAMAIIYLVVVMGLKEYNDLFRTAGLFYISKEILNFISGMFIPEPLKTILGIVTVILSIMYILKFCEACVELLKDKNRNVAESWERYRSYSICYFVAAIIFKILSFIPVINHLTGLFALAAAACSIVLLVWHIILLRDTDKVLRGGDVQ
ncbi:MAG: hypothetical protein K6G72_02890 [Lachnospiraceae bacterium]|nr:hypothetical protein [Lachnospiraceae bacterium]